MPELPEVETVRRGLSALLPGRIFVGLDRPWPASLQADQVMIDRFLLGHATVAVRRLGKGLLIDLDSGWSLVVHLKMTGQLVLVDPQKPERFGAGHPSDSLVDNLPDRSTRVVFHIGDARLYFNDQRKFGWIKLLPTAEAEKLPFFLGLGPDALALELTAKEFAALFQRRSGSPIKAALLDQTVIAGVGNIYADEALWGAAIHPATRVGRLEPGEFDRLFTELRKVLHLSIEQGGSTNRNYVDAEGKRGAYLDFAVVYNRKGKPCPRCSAPIEKIRVAGRGTHYCSTCQKERI